ncbi:hypothetical protein PAXINDRAFT_177375 [Paxillus involutus ATCC 200175]|uniref:Uncharacterized protein n=1 Tax=Paxillus involutus ATCC 200175 TaxID=664439 RepID=A0A0C9SSG5_PAXIN|nr:hypothetical protein PAXINDRAFT_177375 [Paxillus involutus ATCC 200175]
MHTDIPKKATAIVNDGTRIRARMEDLPVEPNLEQYVKSEQFDQECAVQLRKRALVSGYSGDSDYEDSFWSNSNDDTSSVSSVEPSPHEVPRVEAHRYYAGLGPNGRGPKLIYRTSDDKFVEAEGPEAYRRLMKIRAVPEDYELGQDGLWDRIRDQVVELLNKRGIKLTSVDMVQFTWLDKKDDQEIQEEEDEDEDDDDAQNDDNLTYDDIPPIKPIEDGKRHTTNPTIWVGVLPDTLTGAVAHESATEILGLLKELGIAGSVDVAYRESVAKFLHGPDLFAPVSDLNPCKDIIDNLSTPLSLPIAGRKMKMQGTLGFYFRVRNDLYAATACHNVFPLNRDNEEYNYVESAPKKEVVIMGNPAFTNYLASIQASIGTLINTVDYLEEQTKTLTRRVEAGGDDAQMSAGELEETQGELIKTLTKINTLKAFFVDVKKRWSKLKDRVIGYVVWAPPIGVGVPPHHYTRDLCVIKLDKKNIGPEISLAKFKALMRDRVDMPSEFEYPEEGLLPVQGMLSAADINNPNSKNLEGERIRHVIKRGFTTNTTIGTLSGFMSHVRKYFTTGNLDLVELAILPHDDSIAFSRGGDSGALIINALRRSVALLTGGMNKGTDSLDITFTTLMEWVWDLIKEKFPGANLYFDNLQVFLADMV